MRRNKTPDRSLHPINRDNSIPNFPLASGASTDLLHGAGL